MNEIDEKNKKDTNGYKCPVCGGTLIWNSDFMRSEVEDFCSDDDNDDGIVGFYNCKNCHSEIIIRYPSKNEEKQYNDEEKYE